MTTQAEMVDAILKAHEEKRLITCRVPAPGDLVLSLERHIVDNAMAAWGAKPEATHGQAMDSILATIGRTAKRIGNGKATAREMDDMAADVALWLAHELLYADGEKHLVKGPSREDLQQPAKEARSA